MSRINTLGSLVTDFWALGLRPMQTVMVHSSLGKVGYTVGAPVVVIRALLEVLTPQGTLDAESLVPRRRTTLSRFPIMQDGKRVWVAAYFREALE